MLRTEVAHSDVPRRTSAYQASAPAARFGRSVARIGWQKKRVCPRGGRFLTVVVVDTLGQEYVVSLDADIGIRHPRNAGVHIQDVLPGVSVIVAGACEEAIFVESSAPEDRASIRKNDHLF